MSLQIKTSLFSLIHTYKNYKIKESFTKVFVLSIYHCKQVTQEYFNIHPKNIEKYFEIFMSKEIEESRDGVCVCINALYRNDTTC